MPDGVDFGIDLIDLLCRGGGAGACVAFAVFVATDRAALADLAGKAGGSLFFMVEGSTVADGGEVVSAFAPSSVAALAGGEGIFDFDRVRAEAAACRTATAVARAERLGDGSSRSSSSGS